MLVAEQCNAMQCKHGSFPLTFVFLPSFLPVYFFLSFVYFRLNQVKPKTDVEARVYEVLSHKNWGSSSSLLHEIARDTFDADRFYVITRLMWENMEGQRPAAWRVVFKGLTLLEFLIKNGAERCVDDARNHGHILRALGQFNYYEGTIDRGLGVREKTKQVLEILGDDERIREERQKAKQLREKFGGGAQATSSSGGGGGGVGYGNQDWNNDRSSGGGGGGGNGSNYGKGGIESSSPYESSGGGYSGRYGGSSGESAPSSAAPTFAAMPDDSRKKKTKKKKKPSVKAAAAPAPQQGKSSLGGYCMGWELRYIRSCRPFDSYVYISHILFYITLLLFNACRDRFVFL